MNGNCVPSRAEDNSTKLFSFEVPFTNLQLETRGAINNLHVNKITTIETNDTKTRIIDALTRKDADNKKAHKPNFVDKAKSNNDILEVKIEIDSGAKSVILDKIKENNVHTEETINLDESESDNVIDLDENRTDSDVIILDGNKTDSENTIILDDDEIKRATERLTKPDIEVINVEKDTDCRVVEGSSSVKCKNKRAECNEAFKGNSLLTELIEKCLDMENSEGMFRVINKTLLAIYKNVDDNYKRSDAFRKILTKSIILLDIEPEMKFSHIRNLCNELKEHQIKKRIPFITLEGTKDKEQSTSDVFIPKKRRKVDAVIDLDDERNDDQHSVQPRNDYPIGKVYPPIEIDDDSSSDVLLNDGIDDVILIDKNDNNSNKENAKKRKKKRKNINGPKKKGKPRKIDSIDSNQNETYKVITDTDISNMDLERNGVSDPGELLKPRLFVEVLTDFNQAKINNIEGQIAELKKRLEELEQAEVVTDSYLSPYVVCEQLKSKILNLYKKLCELTGTEVTKRHEVRLQVVPGHPQGPVRCLEEFLNKNIDADGNPPFPDMHDVIQCVCDANKKYEMHWTRPQIMSEAHALFTQFGQSMQKRRQKREWKDLMSLVKQDALDPADEDPELQARLLENTRIARKNEDELLDRFAKMEEKSQNYPQLMLSFNQSEESDDDINGDTLEPIEGIVTQIDHLSSDIHSKKANEITLDTGLGPQASKITLAVDLAPKACENALEPPRTGACDFEKAIEGSTVTVCGGNIIVIQPTITCVVPNQNLPNDEAKTIPHDAITPYSSEYQSFLHSYTDKPQLNRNYVQQRARINTMNNLTSNSYVHHKTLAKNELVNAASSANAKNLENDESLANAESLENAESLANAANLAKAILFLVQSECTKTNGLLQETNNHKESVKPTNLNDTAQDVSNSTITSNVLNADNNPECNQNGISVSGLQIYTHTSSQDNINIVIEPNSEMRMPCENIVRNEADYDNSEVETDQTEDTNIIENVDIVKPEPLDIPSMLEELGDGYTATIFDIEDPFLVIEISDSSESEDDDQ